LGWRPWDGDGGEKGGIVRRCVLMLAAVGILAVPLAAQMAEGRLVPVAQAEAPAAPRRLTGMVVDSDGRPVPNAIVYLENRRNLAIYTYIAGEDGSYQFNNLSPDVDYDIHAEDAGRKSETKTLSSFDSHKQARINLKLDKIKGEKK